MSVAPVRRRRRIVRRVLLGLLVVVIVALVGGYWYARPLLMTGTGYAAHNACAVTFVAGRQDPRSDLPPNPLVPYLSTELGGGERLDAAHLSLAVAGCRRVAASLGARI